MLDHVYRFMESLKKSLIRLLNIIYVSLLKMDPGLIVMLSKTIFKRGELVL